MTWMEFLPLQKALERHFDTEFGISKSSLSRYLVVSTTQELQAGMERTFENVEPFALFKDGSHDGEETCMLH